MATCRVYEQPALRQVAGDVLRPGGLALTRQALTWAALPPRARVLDLGCGAGATTDLCRTEFGLEAIGLDISALMLTTAHCRDTALPLVQARGMQIPFGNGVLDAVLAECSLALLPDLDVALKEIHRVLRKRGYLIVSDLYVRSPAGISELRNLPVTSCLTGATTRVDFATRLTAHGFTLMLWEDQTDALKYFTAQLILEHGSLTNFWECATQNPLAASTIQRATAHARPGYFLALAKRNT